MNQSLHLKMLTCYMAWANEIFYRAIAKLPPGELIKNRPMLFDNILNLLNHIYTMDVVWQAHLQSESHTFQSRCPEYCPPFTELWEKQKQVDQWYISYTSKLKSTECNAIINFSFIGGDSGVMSPVEIIQHVVNHTSYHRGHIEGVLYQISIEPPTTDLSVFLRNYYKDLN